MKTWLFIHTVDVKAMFRSSLYIPDRGKCKRRIVFNNVYVRKTESRGDKAGFTPIEDTSVWFVRDVEGHVRANKNPSLTQIKRNLVQKTG